MTQGAIATTVWAVRKTFIIASLALISLAVGIGCVIAPAALPLGIVGLAGLILLWTLPDLKAVPVRLSKWLIYPLIVTSISVPVYFALILPGLPWISVRRFFLFAFVVAVALTLSASSTQRRAVHEIGMKSKYLYYCVCGYFLIQLASMLISLRPVQSLNYMMNTIMTWWLPLIAVMFLLKTRKAVEGVFVALVCCMLFDMVMGLIETRLHSPFLIFMLPASMRAQMISAFPMYAGMLLGGSRNGMYRAVSTYNVSISWGEMAAMVGPIAAHFIAHGRSGWARCFGVVGLAGCFYSIFMSGSRGAYIGFIGAIIGYFGVWAVRHMKVKPGSLVGGMTLVMYSMFSIAVVLSVFFVGRIKRVVLGGGEVQSSNDGRSLEWAKALPKFYQNPIWGYGPGTAADVVGFTNQAGNPSLDSYPINVLVDTGIVGMALFAGMFLGGCYFCVKTYYMSKSETAAPFNAIGFSLLAYSIYRTTLSQTENNTIAFVLVGLVFVVKGILHAEEANENSALQKRSRVDAHATRNFQVDKRTGSVGISS